MSSRAKEKDGKAKAQLVGRAPRFAREAAKEQGQSQEEQDAVAAAAAQLNPAPPEE